MIRRTPADEMIINLLVAAVIIGCIGVLLGIAAFTITVVEWVRS